MQRADVLTGGDAQRTQIEPHAERTRGRVAVGSSEFDDVFVGTTEARDSEVADRREEQVAATGKGGRVDIFALSCNFAVDAATTRPLSHMAPVPPTAAKGFTTCTR